MVTILHNPRINADISLIGNTPEKKKQLIEEIKHRDIQTASRFHPLNEDNKHQNIFNDLIEKYQYYNQLLRNINNSGKTKRQRRLEIQSTEKFNPLTNLNALLKRGNIPIELRPDPRNENLLTIQHSENDVNIRVQEMSDGERSAFLFAATTVTMPSGTVLLIDEPEIHLHQSIVDPFLSALIAFRKDCFFVFSTHNIALPSSHPESKVIIVRSCDWNANEPSLFDAELLTPDTPIPEDIKQYILGVKGKVLFVEGTGTKVLDDARLYRRLFPDFTVISKGSYSEVDKTVVNFQKAKESLHHIEVYGLIDKDQRDRDDIKERLKKNTGVLKVWSVESIYFSPEAIEAVVKHQAKTQAPMRAYGSIITRSLSNAYKVLQREKTLKDISRRLAKNKIRKDLAEEIEAQDIATTMPSIASPEDIRVEEDDTIIPVIKINVKNHFPHILKHLQEHIEMAISYANEGSLEEAKKTWIALLVQYPIDKTDAFDTIAKELKLDLKSYANILISLVEEDEELAENLRRYIEMPPID